MPDLVLNQVTPGRAEALRTFAYWAAFFATSVYGHVALKLAVDRATGTGMASVIGSGLSWWGLTAYAAWGLSCLCWMLVISRGDLLTANSISSLRYALIFAAAVLFLGDELSARRVAGALLVVAGVYLVK